MRLLLSRSVLLIFVFSLSACDPGRDPRQKPKNGIGSFCAIGSAELNMLMDHWAAGFAREREDAAESAETSEDTESTARPPRATGPLHEGRGNGVGPQALLEGRCDMAPMSRKMTDAEYDAFVRRGDGEPIAVPVAVDALALVVPASYQIDTISPDDVFHLFHLGPDKVRSFEDEENAGDIRAYGVNSASERYRWFKNVALHGKKFSDRVIEVAGPLRLVERIDQAGGIGYARLSEMDGNLKTLKIDMGFGKIVPITPETARSGLYPYTRFFYIYLPPKGRPVDPRTHEFIDYVLSEPGQKILKPLGLYSLARKERIYNANRLEKYRQAE